MTDDIDNLPDWERVPTCVAGFVPVARKIYQCHTKVASDLGLVAHTAVTWLPERSSIFVYAPFSVADDMQDAYKVAMFADLAPKVYFVSPHAQPNWNAEVLIKKGAMFPGVSNAWNFANNALGGSRPLSNALVSGLALSGLGYGAGTVMENLFPERYVERGKLRRTLAMTGALGGLGLGAANAYANARATGNPYWKGWVVPNNAQPHGIPTAPQQAAQPPEIKVGNAAGMFGLYAPSIPVDAFNRVVWNDVRKGMSNQYNPYGSKSPWGDNSQPMHTPPQLAAATTGIISGLGAAQNSAIISPATVVSGLASAGVGLATAHLAGRTLGALAGLTPAAQEKLQDMGMWAGMLHAIVPPVLNQLR